jgi:hypothetical protein
MNDDEFDELLRDASASYRLPPEPPREAMWEAIGRARDASCVIPIASRRLTHRWLTIAAGVAAVLVVGIAIGRASRDVAVTKSVASATVPRVIVDSTPTSAATSSSGHAQTVATISNTPDGDAAPSAATNRHAAPVRRLAEQVPASARERRNTASDLASDQSAYRMAVVEHFARTEVLLTGFRAQSHSESNAQVDAHFASVARDLLGTTRVLLATRRGDDPGMTRLLQDLELVLMQLSQYANDGRRVDLDALNQSIEKRNVLPKLRSTIPAGVSLSAGT